jgi:hypothetical protein
LPALKTDTHGTWLVLSSYALSVNVTFLYGTWVGDREPKGKCGKKRLEGEVLVVEIAVEGTDVLLEATTVSLKW